MTRTVALGGTIVECDYLFDSLHKRDGHVRFCAAQFRTASLKSVLPKQLSFAGWSHRKTQRDGLQDFCPDHSPRSMEEIYRQGAIGIRR